MSDYPPPSNPPLPYPDRRRPGGQQQQSGPPGSSVPAVAGVGSNALPYPTRPPAKYSDYQDEPFSRPHYQSDSGPYQQPARQDSPPSSKPNPSKPAPEAPWPSPPTAYNSQLDDYGRQDSHSGRVDKPHSEYTSSNPFQMGSLSSALPSQSPTTYEYDFDRPHKNTGAPPPIPAKVPLSDPSPGGYGQPQPQTYPTSPIGGYPGNQQNSPPPLQTSDYYQGPPAQANPTSPQQYSPQPQTVMAGTSGPSYDQQPYTAQSPTSHHGQPHPDQYSQSVAPGDSAAPQPSPPPPLGYGGSPPQYQTYPPQGSPVAGPQQVPPQPNLPALGLNTQSNQPAQQVSLATPAQPAVPPTNQPPPSQNAYVSGPAPVAGVVSNISSSATQSPPAQNEYISRPPPIPGTAANFPPPPPTHRPPKTSPTSPTGTAAATSQSTVKIEGKEYPIPAFTQTIQTPSQCDLALKEAYFGPYLRFKNVDLHQNLWLGTVLLVLPMAHPLPQLEFHPSGDFSQLRPAPVYQIYTFADYQFLRYELVIPIGPGEQKWTYAITTQTTQTWEFSVASRDQQWRFIAWSCNDFSSGVKKEERDKLGFETMWKNVMDRNAQEGGFHAQLGGGDQIYADRMWKEIPYVQPSRIMTDCRFLIEWLAIKGKDQRQYWPWKSEHENIMKHAYFYYYTNSFAKPYLRDAMAKIPHVFQVRGP